MKRSAACEAESTTKRARSVLGAAFAAALVVAAPVPPAAADEKTGESDLVEQVKMVERAFAKTMADRDHEAFTTFLSQEAVFVSGSTTRGKAAVSAQWEVFFESPEAPFSWEPETVEVLASGELALSTGPVRSAAGEVVSIFTSIWRQEEPGVWRIVFDKGNKACP